MRNLFVDDDIYEFVCQNTKEIGESASSILRRLLKLPSIVAFNAEVKDVGERQVQASETRITELRARLNKLTTIQVVDRFVTILGWIHDQYSVKFELVKSVRGPQRIYFSKSQKEIEDSGCGTSPKQIPGSGWYVMTNSDTVTKRQLLVEVTKLFPFSSDEAADIVRLLEGSQQPVAL